MSRRISVFALKGGCGKTQTTVGLAYALRDKGFKIGIHDIDFTGAKLPTALGMSKPYPLPEVDLERNKKFPVEYNGLEIYSEALVFEEAANLAPGEDISVNAFGQDYKIRNSGLYNDVKKSLEHVEFSADRDYILYDLPPSSSSIALSLFDNLPDLYGCLIVCQPTAQSVSDITRTLDFITKKQIPLIGMVGNMVEALCPHCHIEFYPFADRGVDLAGFCKEQGIPYLASVPLTPDPAILKECYVHLANCVINLKPVNIWEKSFREKLEDSLVRLSRKAIFKFEQGSK